MTVNFILPYSEIGAGEAFKELIYPSMKKAIVHTLLATLDINETRKVKTFFHKLGYPVG